MHAMTGSSKPLGCDHFIKFNVEPPAKNGITTQREDSCTKEQ